MTETEIRSILDQRAEADDANYSWVLTVNPFATKIEAATKRTYPVAEEASRGAQALADELIATGLTVRHQFRIGAAAVGMGDAVSESWRGTVLLVSN